MLGINYTGIGQYDVFFSCSLESSVSVYRTFFLALYQLSLAQRLFPTIAILSQDLSVPFITMTARIKVTLPDPGAELNNLETGHSRSYTKSCTTSRERTLTGLGSIENIQGKIEKYPIFTKNNNSNPMEPWRCQSFKIHSLCP